jgi:hypothetical protein
VLTTQGAAQEWFQDTADIRSRWQDLRFYEGILRDRRAHPNWPASVLIEGGSGHFDCTERMARYYGRYIDLAAKARLPRYPGEELKPVDLRSGFLADLPVPGHENDPVRAYAATPPAARSRPWYFDEPSAREAQAMAAINWQAQSQLPVFVDGNGKAAPLDYQGIAGDVPRITGEDGITFRLSGTLLPRIPGRFKNAGEPLAQAPGVPEIEWICGPVTPVGNGRFRIALDRTWPNPACLAVRHRGTDTIRDVVQPGYVKLRENSEGQPQAIHFEPIDDVVVGTKSVALVARSDSGLPVSWFVVAGPAIVCGDHLELTPIPPRSSFPVAVTVAAWQWGRSTEPKVQTALIVTRSFRITAP